MTRIKNSIQSTEESSVKKKRSTKKSNVVTTLDSIVKNDPIKDDCLKNDTDIDSTKSNEINAFENVDVESSVIIDDANENEFEIKISTKPKKTTKKSKTVESVESVESVDILTAPLEHSHTVEQNEIINQLCAQISEMQEQLQSQNIRTIVEELAQLKNVIADMQNQSSSTNIDDIKTTVESLKHSDSEMITRINEEVGALKKLIAATETKAIAVVNNSSLGIVKREKLVLTGDKEKVYTIETIEDGLNFAKNDETVLLIGKNGQIATGTKAPRSFGKGSAHFRSGSPSEAMLPSAGNGSTRGVIVEGDGDDEKTFVFRAVSKMNRQGFNVFSDGSVTLGKFDKINNSTFGLYHRHSNKDAMTVLIPSKEFDQTVIDVQCNTPLNKNWKGISVTGDCNEESKTEVFSVNGEGSVMSNGTVFVNHRGYAEYFEWLDGNSRNENRVGHTVSIDKNGKLRLADDGDVIVGVVVTNPAIVGNSAWNQWNKKVLFDHMGKAKTHETTVLEWLETEITELKSYYKSSLSSNFAVPQNAMEIQTDRYGNNLKIQTINNSWDKTINYQPRSERNEWAAVCLVGTATVLKSQPIDNRWIKIRDINEELAVYIIR
jgi:tetrahydromethanopterin S-methyltransferase subunit F